MSENNEEIFQSPPSQPEDDFWLEQGRKMVEDSLPALRNAASAFITALGVLEAVYLGVLGFADFIPPDIPLHWKGVFILPLLLWLIAFYLCLEVLMTRKMEIFLHSPEHVRGQSERLLAEKQRRLQWSFWLLFAGIVLAFLLLIARLQSG